MSAVFLNQRSAKPDNQSVAAGPAGLGDAVGVAAAQTPGRAEGAQADSGDGRRWYVAVVGSNREKAVEERLQAMGYDTYVARQSTVRVWRNGRRARVDRVIIPTLVFVHCTEQERRHIVTLPFVSRFLTNKAASATSPAGRLAVIPQPQIDTLRFMLGQTDIPVTFTDVRYRVHDHVRVLRGHLAGLEGEVIRSADGATSQLIVRLSVLGCATLAISPLDLEPLK